MRERFYDDGVIYWLEHDERVAATCKRSIPMGLTAPVWGSDIPSKNPGTFYQDLANPEAFPFIKPNQASRYFGCVGSCFE